MIREPLVFVSCGQVTEAEKDLGRSIVALVQETRGLRAYFAQEVSSLEALSSSIFSNLEKASALVTVMHRRGTVTGRPRDDEKIRASVWIEQEIAIAAFLSHTRGSKIEIAAYCQKGIALEGVRQHVIANAFEFETEDQILADLKLKLAKWDLRPVRSAEPRLAVSLTSVPKVIEQEKHEYRLKAALTNTSNVTIRSVETRLEFPRLCLDEAASYATEDKALANKSHRVFRETHQIQLDPDDTREIYPFGFEVTHDLYYRDQRKWSTMPVKLRVFVNDKEVGSDTKMFSELQDF
jgi:hypothetical protein